MYEYKCYFCIFIYSDDPKKEIKSFPISIGMLHKLCQQHNWKYPNYKIILEENRQENYSWYFAECSVDNHCTTGICNKITFDKNLLVDNYKENF